MTPLVNESNLPMNSIALTADRLARSISIENENPSTKSNRIYQRTKSLYGKTRKKKRLNFIEKEFYFLSIDCNIRRYYSTKQPYPIPTNNYQLSLPPSGFKPIGVQLLARHGSRSLNSHDYDLQTLRIWQIAKDQQMLTQLGKELKIDTDLFMFANNHVG